MIQIHHGEAAHLPYPDSHFDCLVTDPPYGYGFMGKDWDKAVVGVATWKEVLRVMKPGAFGFIMSAPRQDVLCRMIVNLQEAGFETGFTSIYWTYATGFPKAMNISKMVDKHHGRIGASVIGLKKRLTILFNGSGKRRSQIDLECGFRASNYLTLPGEDKRPDPWVNVLPSPWKWQVIKKVLGCGEDIAAELDQFFAEAQREIVGKVRKARAKGQKSPLPTCGAEVEYLDIDITIAASPEAKVLDGAYAGFQPKPAVEVILVVMKPLSERTYLDQAMKDGKGVTWLEAGRIPYDGTEDPRTHGGEWRTDKAAKNVYSGGYGGEPLSVSPQGRFPANLLVSDDVLDDGAIRKCPVTKGPTTSGESFWSPKGRFGFKSGSPDEGTFSRYFDLDAWWEALPESVRKTFPFLIVPKASKAEKNRGCEGMVEKPIAYSEYRKNFDTTKSYVTEYPNGKPRPMNKMKNTHPTVKPVKLMSYLIAIGSRPGDIILDPFMGFGTTLVAAKVMGRRAVGMDNEGGCIPIAEARVKAVNRGLF